MFHIRRQPLSRRHLLQAAGAAISLPFLDAMLPHALAAPSTFQPWAKSNIVQPRMICCYVPNGVNIIEWVPADQGAGYTLSPTLKVLEEHKSEFSVLSGLGTRIRKGATAGRTPGSRRLPEGQAGADYTNTMSLDQLVAEKHGVETRYPSLQLGDQSGTGGAGHSHTLSFDINGTPLPSENSPQRLFERLFVPESAGDRTATHKRYSERRSILDDVAGEAAALEKKLGTNDRKKLDEYLSSVRQTEKQVERLQSWIDKPKAEVQDKGLQLNSKPGDSHDRPMWLDVMLELSYWHSLPTQRA